MFLGREEARPTENAWNYKGLFFLDRKDDRLLMNDRSVDFFSILNKVSMSYQRFYSF